MIICLDKFGKSLGSIDFIELEWSRKYLECGSFSLYIPEKEYDERIKYVQNIGRPETGIVQKIEREEKVDGKFVTLSGFFVDKVLDGGACNFAFDLISGMPSKQILTEYIYAALNLTSAGNINTGATDTGKRVVNKLLIDSQSVFPAIADNNIPAGQPLGQSLYDILSSSNGSFTCTPIFGTNEKNPILGVNLKLWKGRELSEIVRFSDSLNNVASIKYTYDESAEYTRYDILQQLPEGTSATGWKWSYGKPLSLFIDGKLTLFIEAYYVDENNRPQDMGGTYPEKVLYSQIEGVDMIPANEKAIVDKMKKAAQVDMLNNYKIENLEVEVLQERFLYMKDYDLGDVCTVSIDDLKQSYKTRIIEIDEVHHNNMVDITVILGTPQKQKWRAV